MGLFSQYRRFYTEPERISPEIARLNRISAALDKERELQDRYRLSPVTSKIVGNRRRLVEDALVERPKAASIAAALGAFKERDFADPANRLIYRQLRSRQLALENQRQQARQKVKAAASDRRQFNFEGKGFASTLFGTKARVGGVVNPLRGSSWLPSFINPSSVVPCIERMVRREVLFAKGKGGRGYHSPKRRTWASGVPC